MRLSEYLSQPGSVAALAKKLPGEAKVNGVLLRQWTAKKDPRPVPLNRCIDIELATDRQVTCEEMRDDVNWSVLRGTKPKKTSKADQTIRR
jgi:DNA-binding transcriptional regulator YdaS (Cro superfamily)